MLNHRPFLRSPLLAAILISPLFLIIACDAVAGQPNTSASRTSDLGTHQRVCQERLDAIHDWERAQERQLEDEWIDGRRGIWQSAAKLEGIREEARSMQRELTDNCHRVWKQKWSPDAQGVQ